MMKRCKWTRFVAIMVLGISIGAGCHAESEPTLASKRASLDLVQADVLDAMGVLNEQLRTPICIETRSQAKPLELDLRAHSLNGIEALDLMVRSFGGLVWKESKAPAFVNVTPVSLLRDPKWTPNRMCPEIKLEDVTSWEAVAAVSKAIGLEGDDRIVSGFIGSFALSGTGKLEDHWLYKFYTKKLTLTIKAGTVRQALNQIAAAIGNAWWLYDEPRDKGWKGRAVSFHPVTPDVITQPIDPLKPPPDQ